MGSHWVLIGIFLLTHEAGHCFMCSLDIHISSLVKCLFNSFAHFNGLKKSHYCVLTVFRIIVRVLYTFWIQIFDQKHDLQIAFPRV